MDPLPVGVQKFPPGGRGLVGLDQLDLKAREVEESEEEDVNLDEFADEIEPWIIDELKRVGCDTAKSVLELSESELENRTDLEIETIRDVLQILRAEFE